MDLENVDSLTQAVLSQIAAIPTGQVSTYGSIAKAIGYPNHPRFVGKVLKTLPKGSNIPWHRVINAQGRSSFPVNSQAYLTQISRLQSEGIVILNGKVSLKQFLWMP